MGLFLYLKALSTNLHFFKFLATNKTCRSSARAASASLSSAHIIHIHLLNQLVISVSILKPFNTPHVSLFIRIVIQASMHQIIHSFTYPLSIHSSTPSFIHPHLSIHSYFPPFHPSFAPPFLYFHPNFIHYIRSLIRSYILTFIHSFIDSSIHHTFIHSFLHPPYIHSFISSFTCTKPFIHSHIHSFIHSSTPSF